MGTEIFLWIGLGVLVGVVALVVGRRPASGEAGGRGGPTVLGWTVLGLGALTLVLSFLVTGGGSGRLVWPIAAGVATLVAGIGAIVRRDRRWPTWVGLVVGVVPLLFWATFGLGHLVTALTGCPDEFRELATELEPPAGVVVELQGDDAGACRAEIADDIGEDALVAHYQAQFDAHGWQVVPGSGGGGIAAEKDGTVFEASVIDPPDEDPFIVIRVHDADEQ